VTCSRVRIPCTPLTVTEVPSAFRLPTCPGPTWPRILRPASAALWSSAGSSLWSRPNTVGFNESVLPAAVLPRPGPCSELPLSSFSVNAERYESSTARNRATITAVHASRVWSAVRCFEKR